MNYYNEIDPHAAATIREMMDAGIIAPGHVDERSITDVTPNDLRGYTQCHFFAGIAGWSIALQLARWQAGRRVWSMSCPCQPWSPAGKGLGAKDERHLWPAAFDLIRQCRPDVVFGEQVAGAVAKGWLDGIQADLEAEGYALGSAVLGAHSIGAPHIRPRIYWVAKPAGLPSSEHGGEPRCQVGRPAQKTDPANRGGHHVRLAIANGDGLGTGSRDQRGPAQPGSENRDHPQRCGGLCGLGESVGEGLEGYAGDGGGGEKSRRVGQDPLGSVAANDNSLSAPWRDSIWLQCADGKLRRIPAQSILQPVADGISAGGGLVLPPGFAGDEAAAVIQAIQGFPLAQKFRFRSDILKRVGNAIVPQVAAMFIQACLTVPETGPIHQP